MENMQTVTVALLAGPFVLTMVFVIVAAVVVELFFG